MPFLRGRALGSDLTVEKQRIAHPNLPGQLSKFRFGPLHIEDILTKIEEPSEPSLVCLFCQNTGKLGLLKNLVMLLLQQLPAHSAIGGPRKAECFASPALRIPNASVLAEEACANAQHLDLETSAVLSRGFLKSTWPPCIYLRRRQVCLPCHTNSNICWTWVEGCAKRCCNH